MTLQAVLEGRLTAVLFQRQVIQSNMHVYFCTIRKVRTEQDAVRSAIFPVWWLEEKYSSFLSVQCMSGRLLCSSEVLLFSILRSPLPLQKVWYLVCGWRMPLGAHWLVSRCLRYYRTLVWPRSNPVSYRNRKVWKNLIRKQKYNDALLKNHTSTPHTSKINICALRTYCRF